MVEEPADLETLLALHLIPGIGRVRFEKLENVFGSARAALNAPISRLMRVPGIGEKFANRIVSARNRDDARREIDLANKHGVAIITYNDPAYPATLRKTADPPLALYVKGDLRPDDALCVAIVGSRKCTYYGQRAAEHIAAGLAREHLTIVSGMARGIDSAAHRGALSIPGGRTVAVLGSGLLNIYPPENKALFEHIRENGAVVSEFKLNTPPDRGNFPRRNRIIAWMTLGTIVVEADRRSGALISARYATEENRDVFAVPGRIDTPQSAGPHKLIRDGAKLITCAMDVIDEFESIMEPIRELAMAQERGTDARNDMPLFSEKSSLKSSNKTPRAGGRGKKKTPPSSRRKMPTGRSNPKSGSLAAIIENDLLHALDGSEPIHIDTLIERSGRDAATVAGTMTVLEIRRRVKRLPGNFYVLRKR